MRELHSKSEIIILRFLYEQEIRAKEFHWVVAFAREVDLPNRRIIILADRELSSPLGNALKILST